MNKSITWKSFKRDVELWALSRGDPYNPITATVLFSRGGFAGVLYSKGIFYIKIDSSVPAERVMLSEIERQIDECHQVIADEAEIMFECFDGYKYHSIDKYNGISDKYTVITQPDIEDEISI